MKRVYGLFAGDLFFVEELLHKLVAGLGDRLIELLSIFINNRAKLVVHGILAALASLVECICHALRKAYKCLFALMVNGNHRGAYSYAEFFFKLCKNSVKVRLGIVALVYEEHAGKPLSVAIFPCKLGADLGAALAVDHDNGSVSRSYALELLAHEIGVTGSIQNIDLCIVIVDVCSGKRNGIVSCDLFRIEIGNGVAVADLAHSVDLARAEEHSLCK